MDNKKKMRVLCIYEDSCGNKDTFVCNRCFRNSNHDLIIDGYFKIKTEQEIKPITTDVAVEDKSSIPKPAINKTKTNNKIVRSSEVCCICGSYVVEGYEVCRACLDEY